MKNLKMLIFIVLVSSILIQLCLYTGYLNTKDYSSYGQQPKLKMWAEKLFSQIAPQTLQIIENFGSIFDGDLSSNLTWRFDFSYLTQRKFCYSYKEMTSFNPNGKNGDFSNAVEFAKGGLVLFEDYGSGVFQRLAMIHKLEKNDHVFFEIDGEELIEIPVFVNKSFNYPFPKIFLRLNDKGRNRAGLYVTHPISYAKSFRIIVRWPGSDHIETNTAWNESFVCRTTGALCKNVFYHSVISNKLAQGTEIKTHFKDYVSQQPLSKENLLRGFTNALSIMANDPEKFAPGLGRKCSLFCRRVKPGEDIVLFEANNGSYVIHSLRLRVYDMLNGQTVISQNWMRILITMTWDNKEPQVKDIPLAGIFNTGLDYIREVKSLTTGLRNMTCELMGAESYRMKTFDWTAYLYYEMPFWKSAKIIVRIPDGYKPAIICSQFSVKELDFKKYHRQLTGYFSAQVTQVKKLSLKNINLFHLKKQWGHVVAVNYFSKIVGFKTIIENDVMIETNGANSPIFPGTGLEDFFHYFFGFNSVRNSSSPFNGNPLFIKYGRLFLINAYRQNTLDPILFTTGIRIYIEAKCNQLPKSYRKFSGTSSFDPNIPKNSLFTVVLYYGNKGTGGSYTDKVVYGDENNGLSRRVRFIPKNVKSFFISSMFESQVGKFFNRTVVSLEPGQSVTHSLAISINNVGVILRREYHSMVPNQKASVTVDGNAAGMWLCPQRAANKEMSLRVNDYLLPISQTKGKEVIKVTLTAITKWESVSIEVLSAILTM